MLNPAQKEYPFTQRVEKLPEKVVYCAVSVDGDLRVGGLEQQKAAVRAMRQAHADAGILGCTSWLVNEHDFRWTENHAETLLDLARTGECIGLHDHLDTYYLESKPASEIVKFLSSSWQRVHDFFKSMGKEVPLMVHRNGCAMQGREIYRALSTMEYSILSDIWPGMKWHGRMVPSGHPVQQWRSLGEGDSGTICTDNRQVPLNGSPWRHYEDNWLDTNSQAGRFLHVPITCLPRVDPARVQAAVENGRQQVFVVIDTHPYDLQALESGEISPQRVEEYCAALGWIRDRYQAVFIRIDQIPALINDRSKTQPGPENPAWSPGGIPSSRRMTGVKQ